MKSKGPKFNAMSAAMGGMGRKTGMSALAAGPLNQIKNIFGQPKQPTAGGGVSVFGQQKQPTAGSMGAMGAMDQAGSQSIMGQDKIGCSDGMMSKSPLKAGAYEDPEQVVDTQSGAVIAHSIKGIADDAAKIAEKSGDGNEEEEEEEEKENNSSFGPRFSPHKMYSKSGDVQQVNTNKKHLSLQEKGYNHKPNNE